MDKTTTFIFFWLRKISMSVEIYQLSFREFICASQPEISSFFGKISSYLFLFLC